MTAFLKDDRYKHVEVTLSIQVETDQPLRPNDMVNWIQDMPLLAKSVRLQALVPSMSTLLILSLPVSTWNLLPSNPACSFIGFTTSMNLLIPNYFGNISGWLDEVADNTSSAQSDVSQIAPSFTTTPTYFSQETELVTDAAISPSEGKDLLHLPKGPTFDKAPDEFAERPNIKSVLPQSRVPKLSEFETIDPLFRYISSKEASEFWVPGRVNFPRHFLFKLAICSSSRLCRCLKCCLWRMRETVYLRQKRSAPTIAVTSLQSHPVNLCFIKYRHSLSPT